MGLFMMNIFYFKYNTNVTKDYNRKVVQLEM